MNEDVLIKYLNHHCSPGEIQELERWAAAESSHAEWLFEMERIWGLKDELRFSDQKEIETAYQHFMSGLQKKNITQQRPKFQLSLPWIKYAAAAILIGVLSINMFFLLHNNPEEMNIIEVPNGQRVSLILSDGTKVWLNSQSKFTYPANFSSKERKVTLIGEGFFEVSKNKSKPFFVQGDLLRIKVLGTKFNVKSYKNESTFITLTEGSVEVQTNNHEHKITMKPNQQIIYSNQDELEIKTIANAELIRSWTSGEAAYLNQRLDEISKELERKFDVHITITDPELSTEVFTCRFKETATLDQVLNLLKDTRKINYTIQGDQIKIYKP